MGFPVDITLGRCGSGSEQQAVSSSNNNNGTYHNEQRHGMLREAAQDYLRTLKEERRKVEGFKRELPLCIQLLDDAIKTAEEKLVHGTDGVLPMGSEKENGPENPRPTLEEFMPLKRRWPEPEQPSQISSDGEREDLGGTTTKNTKHQPAWMTEAPVWNQTTSRSAERKMIRDPEQSEQEQSCVTSSQQRPTGGAFLPFQQLRVSSNAMPVVSRPKPRSGGFCADLNLGVSGERPSDRTHTLRAASDVEVGSIGTAAAMQQTMPDTPHTCNTDMGIMVGNVDTSDRAGGGGNSSSSTRKARRCWSPELHRRFVSALHQLGGSHIATPKQLRELMKVDGLTNDEVKSHLQKYRLHTRRPGSSSSPHESAAAGQSSSTQTQLVVVGGIWMPPQHGGAASPAVSQPGSHNSGVSDGPAPMGQPASQPGPQFFHSTSLPLDYFAACIHNGTPATGPPMQMLLHRQPIFEPPRAAGTAQSQSSPQGPLQATSHLSGATQGSSSETYESGEEEAKSQSTSWKLCNSRQAAPLREDLVDSSPREEPEQIEETQVQDARA